MTIVKQSSSWHALLGALGVTLSAWALRVHQLADQNIWWDEGWTLWLSRFELLSIALRTAQDEHPPLHYWLMHFWTAVAGTSAFSGRLLSAFFGVLTVVVMYRVGKRVGGVWLGGLAALLLALARFHVWWSQDIKNYTLSGFFALVSVGCVLGLFAPSAAPLAPRARRWLWISYVAGAALALYSHYLAALIFLANNLYVLISLIRRPTQRATRFAAWSLAQLAVLALFAPWLWLYLRNGATWTAEPAMRLGFFLRVAATVFPLGVTTHLDRFTPVIVGLSALTACGALWLGTDESRWHPRWKRCKSQPNDPKSDGALLSLLIVLIAPALIYALSLTPSAVFAPKIQPRYLLILLPGYVMILALGLAWLVRFSRLVGLAGLVLVLAVQAGVLRDYYRGRVLRDEYATLVNTINTFAQPGDLVLLQTDQEWPTFLYYLRAPIPWMGVPSASLLDDRGAQGLASSALLRSNAIWLVAIPDALAKDPQHLLDKWLASGRPRQFERVFGDKRLTLYAAAPRDMAHVPPENFQPEEPRADQLSPELELIGLDLPIDTARGGETVHVVTYWDANSPITLTVELRDPSGATVRAASQPLVPGDRVRAQSDLRLPPRPNGEFTIVADVGEVLHPLATILAAPRFVAPRVATIPNPVDYRLGEGIALAGYELSQTELRPGDELVVTLFWRSDRAVETSYKVFVHLVGAELNPAQNNPLWGQADQLPLNGDLPTNAWAPGDLIPDPYRVRLDPYAPPGEYQVSVGLYDPVSGGRLRVTDPAGREVGDAVVIGTVRVR